MVSCYFGHVGLVTRNTFLMWRQLFPQPVRLRHFIYFLPHIVAKQLRRYGSRRIAQRTQLSVKIWPFRAKTVHDAWDSALYFLDKINTKAWTRLALFVPHAPLDASRMAYTAAINNFWHFCIPMSPFLVASLSWFHTALFVLGTAKSLQFPGLRYFSVNPSIFSLGSLLLIRPSIISSRSSSPI